MGKAERQKKNQTKVSGVSRSAGRADLSVPVTNLDVTAVIDQGCEFEGKLCFHGTVRINGVYRGEIYTPDTLVVGESARVQGEIDAGVVILSGEVTGTVRAKHRVEIHQPAVFRGDIFTPSLSVEEGVIFEGSSRMAQPSPRAQGRIESVASAPLPTPPAGNGSPESI